MGDGDEREQDAGRDQVGFHRFGLELTEYSVENMVSHGAGRQLIRGANAHDGEQRRPLCSDSGHRTVAKKTQDRRVQRTRQRLQDALISMVIEKGYDATTVQDIIDRANVGRATFYAHFADKETLLFSRLEDLRSVIRERQRHDPGNLGFSLVMLDHARSHLPLWEAIASREGGAFVLQRIQRMIADLAATDLKARVFKGTAQQRDVASQYIAGAFVAVLRWWLDQGAKPPPADVDAVFRQLVLRGLEGGQPLPNFW